MDEKVPVESAMSDVEQEMELCARQEAFHAERLSFHQAQREVYAAEREKLRARLEELRAVKESGEWPKAEDVEIPRIYSGRVRLSRLVTLVVEGKSPDEEFGHSAVTREIEERFGAKLGEPVNPRVVSTKLLRMAEDGHLRIVREGRAYYETLFRRVVPAKEKGD